MPRLRKQVRLHLEKARSSALCAVENYNKPGVSFPTRTYNILMVIAMPFNKISGRAKPERRLWTMSMRNVVTQTTLQEAAESLYAEK